MLSTLYMGLYVLKSLRSGSVKTMLSLDNLILVILFYQQFAQDALLANTNETKEEQGIINKKEQDNCTSSKPYNSYHLNLNFLPEKTETNYLSSQPGSIKLATNNEVCRHFIAAFFDKIDTVILQSQEEHNCYCQNQVYTIQSDIDIACLYEFNGHKINDNTTMIITADYQYNMHDYGRPALYQYIGRCLINYAIQTNNDSLVTLWQDNVALMNKFLDSYLEVKNQFHQLASGKTILLDNIVLYYILCSEQDNIKWIQDNLDLLNYIHLAHPHNKLDIPLKLINNINNLQNVDLVIIEQNSNNEIVTQLLLDYAQTHNVRVLKINNRLTLALPEYLSVIECINTMLLSNAATPNIS